MRRNLFAIKRNIHVRLNIKIKTMYDFIGSVIGIILIAFLCSPLVLAVYMWRGAKIDNDNDGKDDIPYRWQKK